MDKSYVITDFKTRLDVFIKSSYATRKDFCKAIGISEHTVNSYFGTRKTKPSFEFINAFLEVHPPEQLYWLFKGVYPTNTIDENGDQVKLEMLDPYVALNAAMKAVIKREVDASVSVSKKQEL